ncbi:cytochrome c biogenesis CcdA family protein [Paraburkholderia kururiensis]|uniref:cytochrome c biogenesis CcdA family protein n=1 Tax=Paraburkholderia kururiensis TaxID=984307 RepID=UPI0005AB9081|nr:cytochrome c biogenesis CcdA family protein [Paraburkholderia kururiensis]
MHAPLEPLFALLAGLFTIASPCVLPVMPILLGTAVERPAGARPLFVIAGFVLSFASFALLLGAVSSTVHIAQQALRDTAIALLALFGFLRLWPRPFEWLMARMTWLQNVGSTHHAASEAGSSNASGFVLGMSLGAVWTPCAGPVLASILVLVVKAQNLQWSALLLTLYAAGAAIPMLGILYGGQYALRQSRAIAAHAQRLQQVFGVLVILTAASIYFQYDTLVVAYLSSFFPSLKGL